MTREQFLKTRWKPYPTMPKTATVAGRISKIELGSLSLENLGSWKTKELEILGVLQKNDWVALTFKEEVVSEITLLAPCLVPPLALSSTPEIQQEWFRFLAQVRSFFSEHRFHEVKTPTLVACPGTEPFLDLFSMEFKTTKRSQKYYLPTSPEIHMKKLISAGYGNIFEIRPCFRNGEISDKHQPEFWMLEWYRPLATLEDLQKDCLDLIEYLTDHQHDSKNVSMAELFQEHLGLKLTPQTTLEDLKKMDSHLKSYELFDDAFFHLFVDRIEGKLISEQPLFVEKYPPSQAALARLTEDGWGDRFELYWKGMELANAYHELNDPELQEQRLQEDLEKKRQTGREVPNLDPEFIQALKSGMPPTSGIALGLDRLFMAIHGIKEIAELSNFPMKN